jgi:hypothetical protein
MMLHTFDPRALGIYTWVVEWWSDGISPSNTVKTGELHIFQKIKKWSSKSMFSYDKHAILLYTRDTTEKVGVLSVLPSFLFLSFLIFELNTWVFQGFVKPIDQRSRL